MVWYFVLKYVDKVNVVSEVEENYSINILQGKTIME